MYYGIDQDADYRMARLCAYAEKDAIEVPPPPLDLDAGIAAPAVLAMIYAGGKGVAPNLQLAVKFACETKGAWDDGADLAKFLADEKQKGTTRLDLDVCDRPTGRQMNYACILRDQGRIAIEVPAALKRFDATGTSGEHARFQKVLAARSSFLDAHAKELSGGTVGVDQASMTQANETEKLWAQTLNDLAAGKLPHYSEQEFAKADRDLNAAYNEAKGDALSCETPGICTTPDELLQAQRSWLAYREAWVAYGKLRWPNVSPDSWRTLFTLERTDMLQNAD
jgi:uncharacterized protein YecT (DUF1311 family)